eukprot:TRINITY_DN2165_c0_g1_i1.p1 TRINITY_DN2165_c0_g1~~TRINITY_DN2165_c0_g1_i1.p1  ORF type:complete len:1709 (-),score=349.89 TRINITY_DN2165_c0_g1_i1:1265-6391(-)
MNFEWRDSPWHFGGTPFTLNLPFPVRSANTLQSLSASSTFVDSFCEPQFDGTWSSISNELGAFTPCFIDIVILGTAHLTMIVMAAVRFRFLQTSPHRMRLTPIWWHIQGFAAGLALFCAVVPLMQLSARISFAGTSNDEVPLPPSEIVSLVLASVAWAAASIALFRELRSSTSKGMWCMRFAIIYVTVGQLARLRFFVMLQQDYRSFFVWLFFIFTAAQLVLAFYAALFFPTREFVHRRGRQGRGPKRQGQAAEVEPPPPVEEPPAVEQTTDYQLLPEGPPEDKIFPELNAGILSRITFQWMNPVMRLGHQRPLQDEDVWQLDPVDKSSTVSVKFQEVWKEEQKKKSPTLLWAVHSCFAARFWSAGIYKLLDSLTQFIGPVMLKSLLSSMQSDEPAWHGYVYATIIFAGIVAGVFFDAQFFTKVQRVGYQLRQALVAAVFRKSLRLSPRGKQGYSTGRIVNMMTNDTEALQAVVQQLHNVWSAPFRIVMAMVLLYQELGIAALIGLIVLLFLIPIQAFMMNQQRLLVKKSLRLGDKRVGIMNEILAAMDVVKCYTWEESFKNKILLVRTDELNKLRTASYISALNFFIVNSVPVIVTVVGFGVFSLLGGNLTPAKAFTSISLFSILRMPLYMLPQLITQVVNANVSVKRLQEMLLAEERAEEGTPSVEPNHPVIEVQQGTFSWGAKGDRPTLKDITLEVRAGALVAIVGGTGEGKSSLLSALIGELPPAEGHSAPIVRGRLAYVPQISWIFNATVRDNILFGLPYEAERYDRAIRVSALARDLDLLSGGDLTEIGERGVNISGGQKQRVSIARAVYADADVYFFDDPLSALDSHVAKQVFDECVHDALAGRTRVMVTNQLHFLPRVDYVVLLKDGRIADQGTFESLMEQSAEFQSLMEQAGSLEDSSSEPQTLPTSTVTPPSSNGPALSNGTDIKPSLSDGKIVAAAPEVKAPAKVGTQLISMEDRETGVVSVAVIGRYMAAMGGFWIFAIVLGLYIMVEVPRVGSSLWVGVWSSAEATGEAPHSVTFYISIYALLCFGQVFFVLCRQFCLALSTLRAAATMHEGMLSAVLRAPMSFFQMNPVGRLINRFTKDTSDIDKNLSQQMSLFLQSLFSLLSTFGLIGALNPFALWAIVPLLLAFYFVYVYYQDTSREIKRLDAITRSPVYAQFGEALNGQATIRAYKAEERMARMNGAAMDRNTRFGVLNMAASRWLSIRLETLGGLMVWATAIFAVLDVQRAEDQAALAGSMGIILSYSLTITMLMTNVLRQASMAENSFNAVERVSQYADLEGEAPPVIEDRRPPKEWPAKGEVKFENVVMRYRDDLPPVLKGLSAHVNGGEKVGVVGRTGAGKSSLFNALFRLVEIESGKIEIDSCDLAQMGLLDVRRSLMIIPQTPVLFTGTIRFNLDPFEEHSEQEVLEALARAHMDEVVGRMPLGLDTEVLEGGDNFSVGQRQLLSLARALLRRSKILVLDEATAAVDVGTDALIQKTIREEFKSCTMLIIAHRLNTIVDSDRILVMDAGQAVEYDTPANLLADEESVFSGMVKSTGAANAKHLTRIAFGELDIQEEIALRANAEKQKWAKEAATKRATANTEWALAKSTLNSSLGDLHVAPGAHLREAGILQDVEGAVMTLRGVMAGERAAELEEAMRRHGIDEERWWMALLRVLKGLATMGHSLEIRLGDVENSPENFTWTRRLAIEGHAEDDE